MKVKNFNQLITENTAQFKGKTVQFLNTMFNEDISSKQLILLVKNNSDCNIIVRINGKMQYKLPVKTDSQNTIVIDKGEYTLSSIV